MRRALSTGPARVETRNHPAPELRILVIEDQLSICELYSVALRSVNRRYQIILAHSGEDGVEAALKERPHLVILDLSLPGMSGKEVAKRLKVAGVLPGVPLIIASGEAQGVTDVMQASAYLVKPFPLARLVESVQEALRPVAA